MISFYWKPPEDSPRKRTSGRLRVRNVIYSPPIACFVILRKRHYRIPRVLHAARSRTVLRTIRFFSHDLITRKVHGIVAKRVDVNVAVFCARLNLYYSKLSFSRVRFESNRRKNIKPLSFAPYYSGVAQRATCHRRFP